MEPGGPRPQCFVASGARRGRVVRGPRWVWPPPRWYRRQPRLTKSSSCHCCSGVAWRRGDGRRERCAWSASQPRPSVTDPPLWRRRRRLWPAACFRELIQACKLLGAEPPASAALSDVATCVARLRGEVESRLAETGAASGATAASEGAPTGQGAAEDAAALGAVDELPMNFTAGGAWSGAAGAAPTWLTPDRRAKTKVWTERPACCTCSTWRTCAGSKTRSTAASPRRKSLRPTRAPTLRWASWAGRNGKVEGGGGEGATSAWETG